MPSLRLANQRMQAGLLLLLLCLLVGCQAQTKADSINIGLIAPFSGAEARVGQALQRGMLLAIAEINAAGGVQNRPLALVSHDIQRSLPGDETAVLQNMLAQDKIVALFGGTFDGTSPNYLPAIHQNNLPFINSWGTITQTTKNQYQPNYIFCLGATDTSAGQFLAQYGTNIIGSSSPGILADTSDWSQALSHALIDTLTTLNVPPVQVTQFERGETNMQRQLHQLHSAQADAVYLLASTAESIATMRSLATMGWNVPVLSHWGGSSRAFIEQAGVEHTRNLFVLQTFAFPHTLPPKSTALITAYHQAFGTNQLSEINEPTAVAQAYDGVFLLAQAIEQGNSINGSDIKAALEQFATPYDGLIKQYKRPFPPPNHIALTPADYIMTNWQINRLLPAQRPKLEN